MNEDNRIDTERLVLRPHTTADFDDMHAMWSDPAVTQNIGGQPSTQEETWARLLRYAGTWSLLGYGFWAVRRHDTGAYLGDVGFLNARRDTAPNFRDQPELGYALVPAAHGRGYATEAARAAVAWGDRRWGEHATVCMIGPDNAPSRRIADKLGYVEMATSEYKGRPVVLFSRRGARV